MQVVHRRGFKGGLQSIEAAHGCVVIAREKERARLHLDTKIDEKDTQVKGQKELCFR